MSIGIYLDGTTSGVDGTLEVPGDLVGISLGAVGDVGVFHLRASETQKNAEQVVVNAPTDCQVSKDGVTYGSTATYAIGDIDDTNTPCYIKRTSSTADPGTWTGLSLTPRLAVVKVVGVFMNDFSAGEAIDTDIVMTAKTTNGVINTTANPNFLTVYTAADADAAIVGFKNVLSPSTQERLVVKYRCSSVTEGSILAAQQTDLTCLPVVSSPRRIQVLRYSSGVGRFYYLDATAAPHFWDFANGWVAAANGTFPQAADTDYICVFEYDSAGWVLEMRNGDGSPITNGRTSKVAWSNTYPASGTYKWGIGDFLTDYYRTTTKVSYMRRETGIGAVS